MTKFINTIWAICTYANISKQVSVLTNFAQSQCLNTKIIIRLS